MKILLVGSFMYDVTREVDGLQTSTLDSSGVSCIHGCEEEGWSELDDLARLIVELARGTMDSSKSTPKCLFWALMPSSSLC